MSRLTLIVAATTSNGIGKHSRLPWRLPSEMAYFARVTSTAPEGLTNAVLMGRNTWESIPQKFRPLSGRVNVVISRNSSYELVPVKDGAPAYLHTGLDSALRRLSNPPLSEGPFTEKPVHRRFIIGGASLYSETLAFSLSSHSPSPAFVDRVLLTRILSPSFEDCDVFMPDFLAETAVSSDERTEVRWQRSTHERLNEWVGFEVPQGVQEEKGVRYEFQMWVR